MKKLRHVTHISSTATTTSMSDHLRNTDRGALFAIPIDNHSSVIVSIAALTTTAAEIDPLLALRRCRDSDLLLHDEITARLISQQAKSVDDAALQLAREGKIQGYGTELSLATRLAKSYRARYHSGK